MQGDADTVRRTLVHVDNASTAHDAAAALTAAQACGTNHLRMAACAVYCVSDVG